MSKKHKDEILPVPVSKQNLEEVIRALKAGLTYHAVSEDTRRELGKWIAAREDELDTEEGKEPSHANDPENEPEAPVHNEFEEIHGTGIEGERETFAPYPPLLEEHPPYVENTGLEKLAETAGSMEAAAAEQERENFSNNPPPFLRGGNP